MHKSLTTLKTPPEFSLTKEQQSIYSEFRAEVDTLVATATDALVSAGLSDDQAASAIVRVMHEEAAKGAIFSALIDGRNPNKDWHIHNSNLHFDRCEKLIKALPVDWSNATAEHQPPPPKTP